MSYSLLWLPSVLKAAGLKVATVDGWESRGLGDAGRVMGVMCHYTVGAPTRNMPSLETLKTGRKGLAGPLAQLGLGRDGTFYVIAAGKCQHAGRGQWNGVQTGNTNFIGIEAENTGHGEVPSAAQMEAYVHGTAVILMHERLPAICCAGHKEYALPPGRKVDPDFDMNMFRMKVDAVISGIAPPPSAIPSIERDNGTGGAPPRPTLLRGASGPLVEIVQQRLGVTADGHFGPLTEAALRAFQREKGLVADGRVGPNTWRALDQQ
jgi:hypothetical protein